MTMPLSSADYGPPPAWFRLRCAIGFCIPMFSGGIILPFFPLWLGTLNFDAGEISLVLAIPLMAKILVAPVVAFLADRMEERTHVLIWSAVLSVILTLSLLLAGSFWSVLILYSLLQGVFSPYMPVVESILLTGVRRWGFSYGSMRLWGSIGFVLASMIAGVVTGWFGGASVVPLIASAFGLAVVSAFIIPRTGKVRRPKKAPQIGLPTAGSLSQLHLQAMLIGACLVQASHAMLYTFSSIYWTELGFSGTSIGFLWSVGVLAEVVVFATSGWLLTRVGPWTLLRLGCAFAVFRWLLFPLPLGLPGYLLLQLTHAFTFAFVHVGVQQRIVEAVGESHEASAQGNYFFYNGAFMAGATLAAGPLYREFGQNAYLLMAGLAFIGLMIVIASWYLVPRPVHSSGKRD